MSNVSKSGTVYLKGKYFVITLGGGGESSSLMTTTVVQIYDNFCRWKYHLNFTAKGGGAHTSSLHLKKYFTSCRIITDAQEVHRVFPHPEKCQ